MDTDYLINLNENEYLKSYNDAIELFKEYTKKLQKYDSEDMYESENQPMHPNCYYQLISVSGFTKTNGATYKEHLEQWENHYKKYLKIK